MILATAAADSSLDGAVIIPHGMIVAGAVVLGLIALALAWPVPVALSRSSWPMRAP